MYFYMPFYPTTKIKKIKPCETSVLLSMDGHKVIHDAILWFDDFYTSFLQKIVLMQILMQICVNASVSNIMI